KTPARAAGSNPPLHPSPDRDCLKSFADETLPWADARCVHARNSDNYILMGSAVPQPLLARTLLDRAAPFASTIDLADPLVKPDTLGRRSPSAHRSEFPPRHVWWYVPE